MAVNLPYLSSNKNVATLFDRIMSAGRPEVFSQAFLKDTIGLKSTTDRPLITLLKALGFLDQGSKPTPAYNELKNRAVAKKAMARAIRSAYDPLFRANESADRLDAPGLKGLIAQVAGTDEGMTDKIAWTFNALAKNADFSDPLSANGAADEQRPPDESPEDDAKLPPPQVKKLRQEFHFNIQVHLPGNSTEETYRNIFNALRKTFE